MPVVMISEQKRVLDEANALTASECPLLVETPVLPLSAIALLGVFAFGGNAFNQSSPESTQIVEKPTQVTGLTGGRSAAKLRTVHAGCNTSFAVSQAGELFSWGKLQCLKLSGGVKTVLSKLSRECSLDGKGFDIVSEHHLGTPGSRNPTRSGSGGFGELASGNLEDRRLGHARCEPQGNIRAIAESLKGAHLISFSGLLAEAN